MNDFNANQMAKLRDRTNGQQPLNLKTRTCPACLVSRSLGQFAPGKTKCNKCRGVK